MQTYRKSEDFRVTNQI